MAQCSISLTNTNYHLDFSDTQLSWSAWNLTFQLAESRRLKPFKNITLETVSFSNTLARPTQKMILELCRPSAQLLISDWQLCHSSFENRLQSFHLQKEKRCCPLIKEQLLNNNAVLLFVLTQNVAKPVSCASFVNHAQLRPCRALCPEFSGFFLFYFIF